MWQARVRRWAQDGAAKGVLALFGLVLAFLAWRRFATFHNETFDLAFYTRMAWGLARAEFWDPIVNAHVLGLHLSPILLPLGWVGALFGTAPVLLVVQAGVVAWAAWPLARMAARRLGKSGLGLVLAVWCLSPNLSHVATYEFHPGTLAILPLGYAIAAIDAGDRRGLIAGCLGTLACREDFALVTIGLAWLAGPRFEEGYRLRNGLVGASALWLLGFVLILHPMFSPAEGSLQLHFGKWGKSAGEAVLAIMTQPKDVFLHLSSPERLLYLPRLIAPFAFLPVLAPRWLVPVAPLVAINLLSDWPTTVHLDSHYQTPLVPFLVAAAIDGARRVSAWIPERVVLLGAAAAALFVWTVAGGGLLSADFEPEVYRAGRRSRTVPSLLARIPPRASVQAPYALLPHLAEREVVTRSPPPDRVTDYVILDGYHRRRYAGNESVLRTEEEPVVRDWLARDDHGLVEVAGSYLLLQRGLDPRAGYGARYVRGHASAEEGVRLTECLRVRPAKIRRRELILELVATNPCPPDLAVRIGASYRPSRVELLFSGHLSPVHLRRGDLLQSVHTLSWGEVTAIRSHGLRVGALRSSGARPHRKDPIAVDVSLANAG